MDLKKLAIPTVVIILSTSFVLLIVAAPQRAIQPKSVESGSNQLDTGLHGKISKPNKHGQGKSYFLEIFRHLLNLDPTIYPLRRGTVVPNRQPHPTSTTTWITSTSAQTTTTAPTTADDVQEREGQSLEQRRERIPGRGDPRESRNRFKIPNRSPPRAASTTPLPDGISSSESLGVGFENDQQCRTKDNLVGECRNEFDCQMVGGRVEGLCPSGGVCCTYRQSLCGFESNREVIHFRNPGYPETVSQMNDLGCVFRINLLTSTCELKIEFLKLELHPMDKKQRRCNGDNALGIASSISDAEIPIKYFCGNVSGGIGNVEQPQHMLVHVSTEEQVRTERPTPRRIFFRVAVNDFASRWNLRLTQVRCGSRKSSPLGCAQYYDQPSLLSSFNLADGSYAADMDYTICVGRKQLGSCGIKLSVPSTPIDAEFIVGGEDAPRRGSSCKGDYISIGGEKSAFCGDFSSRKEIKLKYTGPMSLRFHSSDANNSNGTGFAFQYEFIHGVCDFE